MFNLFFKSITAAAFITSSHYSHRPTSASSLSRPFTTAMPAALPEKITVLEYAYVPDVLEKRGPYRSEHLELAQSLIAEDRCLAGGPFTETAGSNPAGAYFWFTSEEAAQEFVSKDPYVTNGIVTGHKIYEWSVVVQK